MARATFAPAPASVLYLDFVVLHIFYVPEDPASLLIDRLAGSGPSNLLSGSSSICGDLPGSSRTRARRARKFFNLDGDKEMSERAVVSVPTTSRRFSENLSPQFAVREN